MSRMVEIRQGKLRGVEGTYADIYRGIPYAKPPVGELRFHAPEPPEPWEGIYAADTFSCICPQLGQEPGSFYEKEFYSDPAFMPPQNEDCLYLNIWTPKSEEPRREEDLCPVAVWFHGGGFINGFGSEIEFDGEAYAKRGIVLVTVNYRLGLLGYFAHPDLTARDGHSGNYGLLDQIAAIDWVRENIAAFGGNPDQITIFGQSAGGMSVRALISSPLMKGKVRGAILQSCGGYHSPLTAAGDAGVLESAAVQFLKEKNMTLEDLCQVPDVQTSGSGVEAAIQSDRTIGDRLAECVKIGRLREKAAPLEFVDDVGHCDAFRCRAVRPCSALSLHGIGCGGRQFDRYVFSPSSTAS